MREWLTSQPRQRGGAVIGAIVLELLFSAVGFGAEAILLGLVLGLPLGYIIGGAFDSGRS